MDWRKVLFPFHKVQRNRILLEKIDLYAAIVDKLDMVLKNASNYMVFLLAINQINVRVIMFLLTKPLNSVMQTPINLSV